MHDASIVQGVVDAILDKAGERKVGEVQIALSIGVLRCIHAENLRFWIKEMLKESLGKKLKLKISIKTLQPEIKCKCGFKGKVKRFQVTHEMAHLGMFEMRCPKCNSPNYEILKGNEAAITSMKLK